MPVGVFVRVVCEDERMLPCSSRVKVYICCCTCGCVKACVQSTSVYLTQLVEVRVDAVRPRDRTDQPGFDEGAPLVHQHSLTSHIVLAKHTHTNTHSQSVKADVCPSHA